MKYQQVFCSGCDRDVRVIMEDSGHDDAQANVHDPELICLEVGEWCTGNLCPLGAAAPNAMIARLVRNGLPLDNLQVTRGHCEGCETESDLALYGREMAACLVCGTTRARPAPPETTT